MSEDCLGARFEILLDGKTQYCRDTLNTAMGAANIIQRQNSNNPVAESDPQSGWPQPLRGPPIGPSV
jgi:hypothetical protein